MPRMRTLLIAAVVVVGCWAVWVSQSLPKIDVALSHVSPRAPAFATNPAAVGGEEEKPAEDTESVAPIEQVASVRTGTSQIAGEIAIQESASAAMSLPSSRFPVDGEPIPITTRCYWWNGGVFPREASAVWGGAGWGWHQHLSDRELQAQADSGTDGLAQYVYAQKVILGIEADFTREIPLEWLSVRYQWLDDSQRESLRHYLIQAIRQHNWRAADRLAVIAYPTDKIEARAWRLIEQQARGQARGSDIAPDRIVIGGTYDDVMARNVQEEVYPYSEAEEEASVVLSEEYIEQFDLSSGFGRPAECPDPPPLAGSFVIP